MQSGLKMDSWLSNAKRLKVEITSYCNAACPGCTRNVTGGDLVHNLSLEHMSLDLWTRLMWKDTKDMNFSDILFDGAVGDICMHPKALEFIRAAILHHPESEIQINTNGGARNEIFWGTLGKILKDKPHRINFAIDGLEDTHHIHRRKTTYDMVVRNMKAFIAAGGQANWVYTLFDHNTHQQEEAHNRAIALNCGWFNVRQSCIDGEDMYTKTKTEEYEIGTDTIRDLPESFHMLREDMTFSDNEVEEVNSECTAFRERQIQIDFRGILWPCSYIYSTNVFSDRRQGRSPFYDGNLDPDSKFPFVPHPENTIDLHHHSLVDILSNNFYTETLPDALDAKSWDICQLWCMGCA